MWIFCLCGYRCLMFYNTAHSHAFCFSTVFFDMLSNAHQMKRAVHHVITLFVIDLLFSDPVCAFLHGAETF